MCNCCVREGNLSWYSIFTVTHGEHYNKFTNETFFSEQSNFLLFYLQMYHVNIIGFFLEVYSFKNKESTILIFLISRCNWLLPAENSVAVIMFHNGFSVFI